MVTVDGEIRRITLPLPLGIDHVHCYLLPRESGGWTLVDTGLGFTEARERWQETLSGLKEPVEQIFVTHFHPDHVGGGAIVAGLTGSPVVQGRLDYAYCLGAWAGAGARERSVRHLVVHGMPPAEAEEVGRHQSRLANAVNFARDPRLIDPGEQLDGWDVLALPGHADGHLGLHRDGVLVVGDALLDTITPNVGIYPEARPDPLSDFFDTLELIVRLAPRIALPGHGRAIEDPAGRAAEILAHHRERLEVAAAVLDGRPRSAYEVSLDLFPERLPPPLRRMALAEALAHLEHLAIRKEIAREESEVAVAYRRAP